MITKRNNERKEIGQRTERDNDDTRIDEDGIDYRNMTGYDRINDRKEDRADGRAFYPLFY